MMASGSLTYLLKTGPSPCSGYPIVAAIAKADCENTDIQRMPKRPAHIRSQRMPTHNARGQQG